jgi:hypothetical protein
MGLEGESHWSLRHLPPGKAMRAGTTETESAFPASFIEKENGKRSATVVVLVNGLVVCVLEDWLGCRARSHFARPEICLGIRELLAEFSQRRDARF